MKYLIKIFQLYFIKMKHSILKIVQIPQNMHLYANYLIIFVCVYL